MILINYCDLRKGNKMSDTKFFVCEHCGNLVGMIHSSGVPMKCCGQNMTELTANTTEAAVEKHIPVIAVDGSKVVVTVGSVIHPMVEEHHIEWIYLQTSQGGHRKTLAVGTDPVVEFALSEGETALAAYAYCNLHGLWKAEV